ncbi:MAG: hypothetical protein IT268_09360 [Saprospiraceae bacterium]|nr:hypothetical protein [Saprospiraceae bacterium]
MVFKFLQLQWKSFFRGASLGKDMAVKILMGFVAVYFGLSFLALGVFLYPLLSEENGVANPMQYVNRFVAVWILAELIVRFLLQSLPVMNVRPLLTTNISKSNILHYLLARSIFSFFNWMSPIIFIPFGIWCIVKNDYTAVQISGWWIAMLSIMLSLNFLNFLLNKYYENNPKVILAFVAFFSILSGLEKFNIFSTSELAGNFMEKILSMPILSLLPLLMCFILYYVNFLQLKATFYLDTSFKGKSEKIALADLGWTSRFGEMAKFLRLDLRLIWRNKRPKSVLWVSLLFAAYGLIFYTNRSEESINIMKPFVGIFMTGIFALSFGQFIPAWDSGYYPLLMTQKTSIKQYLNSKAGLLYLSIVIMTLITVPYVYFGINILFLNIACAIYNAGINIPVLLYSGSFNKKRIDLDKSSFWNTQGTGAAQWIVGLPLLILPMLIWWLNYKFINEITATTVLALTGIIGLLLKNVFMDYIEKGYKTRKYAMIHGFRQVN